MVARAMSPSNTRCTMLLEAEGCSCSTFMILSCRPIEQKANCQAIKLIVSSSCICCGPRFCSANFVAIGIRACCQTGCHAYNNADRRQTVTVMCVSEVLCSLYEAPDFRGRHLCESDRVREREFEIATACSPAIALHLGEELLLDCIDNIKRTAHYPGEPGKGILFARQRGLKARG
jgi:hypothetical protein